MSAKHYLPQAFDALYNWLYAFENYFASNAPRFGLTQDTIMPLQELIIAFKIAKDKADAPNAGSADRIERKEKADTVTEAARTFVNRYLRYNPDVTDRTRLTNSAFDTATPYRFSFAGAERGRHLYFALRRENTRGEKGLLSTIFDAIIP
jgi:hypothetical protein